MIRPLNQAKPVSCTLHENPHLCTTEYLAGGSEKVGWKSGVVSLFE